MLDSSVIKTIFIFPAQKRDRDYYWDGYTYVKALDIIITLDNWFISHH